MRNFVPAGWKIAELDSVAGITLGQSPPSSTYNTVGDGLPFFQGKAEFGALSPTPVKWCSAPVRVAHPGDVLISVRAPVGPTNLADTECCIGRGLAAITPLGGMPSKYYLYYLRHSVEELVRQATGSTFQAINGKQLRAHTTLVPPLPEQRRIVETIESHLTRLDDAVASLERVQRNLERYRASVLKAAVEGRLVSTEAELARQEGRDYETADVLLERILAERKTRWIGDAAEKSRAKAEAKALKASKPWTLEDKAKARVTAETKYKEPQAPDTTDLADLPEGWCWTTIDITSKNHSRSICAGPFGTIFKAKDFRPEGVPIIFLRHVKPDEYRRGKPTYMDRAKWDELFEQYSVFGGELLVTKLGDPPGECAVFPRSEGTAMLTPDVMKLEVHRELSPRYIMHYMNSLIAKQFAFGVAFGTTRLRLTLPLFRSLLVPIPPLDEQDRIVEAADRQLSLAKSLEDEAEMGLRRIGRLRQAILKWAFEGKLVEQDPADEPSSALLDRIRSREAGAG